MHFNQCIHQPQENHPRAPSSRGRERQGDDLKIHRSTTSSDSTGIPVGTLQDQRLSYSARGLLLELLSGPDTQNVNADELSRQARRARGDRYGEGRGAMRAAFAELERHGYLIRRRTKDSQGLFTTRLDLYDTPRNQDSDTLGTPGREPAESGGPRLDEGSPGNLPCIRVPRSPEPEVEDGRYPRGHYLYRHWDHAGRLLYVGVTDRPRHRARRHAKNSPWMVFQARMTVEPYSSRAAAEEAETQAIANDQPLFNVAGNETMAARQRLEEYLAACGRSDLLAPAVSRG